MPECRGITVHVTDVHGQSLPEWGVQHINLKQQSRRVSAYIQSTTDAIFQISLQPRIPWCDHDHPYSDDSDDWPAARWQERDIAKYKAKKHGVPPYAFLAALYLDGRMEPERRTIIFTDPDDPDYNRPAGKVLLKHRMVQLKDGSVIEHGWAFKEKAIELVFDKLNLKGHQDNSDEAALVNTLLSQLSAVDKDQGNNRVGQILVEIRRVKVGHSYIDPRYRTRFKEGQDDDVDTNELQGDITHRIGFVRKGTIPRHEAENPQIVQYRPWKSGEGVYASFSFFYRSRDQLAKFGFPGFPPLPNGTRKDKQFLENTFSNLTPLSISKHAKSSAKQAKAEADTFKDKVKKRNSSRISTGAQMTAQSDRTLSSPLKSFSNPGEKFKSIAALKASHPKSISKSIVPPPLPPTLQDFKNIQLEKLASQTSRTTIHDEADMDVSEPETESDLESLLGDDKIPTDPNPDEEHEKHRDLREQLGQIEIRKRRHNEVDQKLDSRLLSDEYASLREVARRHGMGPVQNEDDDEEEAPSKRIRSGTA